MIKVDNVTRVEVIDNTGRAYVKYNVKDIELSFQDDCRTLKIFVEYDENGNSTQPSVQNS